VYAAPAFAGLILHSIKRCGSLEADDNTETRRRDDFGSIGACWNIRPSSVSRVWEGTLLALGKFEDSIATQSSMKADVRDLIKREELLSPSCGGQLYHLQPRSSQPVPRSKYRGACTTAHPSGQPDSPRDVSTAIADVDKGMTAYVDDGDTGYEETSLRLMKLPL
jgi:hypothetical protein